VQLFCQYSFANKLQRLTVSSEKMLKTILYKKGACLMFVKWTPVAVDGKLEDGDTREWCRRWCPLQR